MRGIEGLIDSRIEFRGLRLWIVGGWNLWGAGKRVVMLAVIPSDKS